MEQQSLVLNLVEPIVGITCFLVSSLIILAATKKKESKSRVKELWIYPIKSCCGVKVDRALISKRGFLWDRAFMLADKSGKFVSQRKYPKMALIVTELDIEKGVLIVSAPTMNKLIVSLAYPVNSVVLSGDVWGDKCNLVKAAGKEGDEWFSRFLDVELQFVRMEKDFVRPTDPEYAPNSQTSLADGFPFLVISSGTLDSINSKLSKKIMMDRFRPNIIVEGCPAYDEDTWGDVVFSCGNKTIKMKGVKPCSRCTIPNIDPVVAEFDPHAEPSKTMKSFRTGEFLGFNVSKWKKQIFVGQNLDHEGREGGEITVGTEVTVSSRNFKFTD